MRRGEKFSTRKELAAKIGITPALINYYFGKRDFLSEPIRELVEGYAERFRQHLALYKEGRRAALLDGLSTVVRMYVDDCPLVTRYAQLVTLGVLPSCAITSMKKCLESIFVDPVDDEVFPDHMARTMAAMIWGACSATRDEAGVIVCVDLANRLIASFDDLCGSRGRGEFAGCSLHAVPASFLPGRTTSESALG